MLKVICFCLILVCIYDLIYCMKFVPYWKRDIKYYIRRMFTEDKSYSVDLVAERIIEHFKEKYITEKDKKLLNFVFKENVSQEDLNSFLEQWDIEEEGGYKALMFSYFMSEHPELEYPEYVAPRLKGILQYFRFRNLKYISHFKKVSSKLIEAGIKVLIMKGGAIRHFCPDFPRVMADIDILVPKDDYQRAKEIALGFGYTYEEYGHSIDLHEPDTNEDVLDIHHKLDMKTSTETLVMEDFFNRASVEKVFGVEGVYMPCIEDMIFITLVNFLKNLVCQMSVAGFIYTIWDCAYFVSSVKNINWDIIKQNAIKTHTEDQVYIAIKFINNYIPQKLPALFEEEFPNMCSLYLYNEWFIKKLRKKSHSLKLTDIFKTWFNDIKTYINFRPQYVLYQRRTIKENPKLAKIVLEKQRLVK